MLSPQMQVLIGGIAIMYKCFNCRNEFLTPVLVREVHYECCEHPYEMFDACPYCGDGDIEEKEENQEEEDYE